MHSRQQCCPCTSRGSCWSRACRTTRKTCLHPPCATGDHRRSQPLETGTRGRRGTCQLANDHVPRRSVPLVEVSFDVGSDLRDASRAMSEATNDASGGETCFLTSFSTVCCAIASCAVLIATCCIAESMSADLMMGTGFKTGRKGTRVSHGSARRTRRDAHLGARGSTCRLLGHVVSRMTGTLAEADRNQEVER